MILLSLYGLWLLFNGRVTLEILLIGMPVVGLVYILTLKAMRFSLRRDLMLVKRIPFMLSYLLFLWKEVISSSLRVMKRIWSSHPPESVITGFNPDLGSDHLRMILANSITLTPGTITIEAEKNLFIVHCLEADSASSLPSSAMCSRIKEMEGLP